MGLMTDLRIVDILLASQIDVPASGCLHMLQVRNSCRKAVHRARAHHVEFPVGLDIQCACLFSRHLLLWYHIKTFLDEEQVWAAEIPQEVAGSHRLEPLLS